MKDPVSEGGEASDAEADSLEYLSLVVAALCEAVGIRDIEAVEDILGPVAHSGYAGFKFRDMAVFSMEETIPYFV